MPQTGPQFPRSSSHAGAFERAGASLLILYSLAVTVSVAARVISGADQATALESIMMIGVNSGWYVGHQTANLIFRPHPGCSIGNYLPGVPNIPTENLALVGAFMLITAGIFSSISSIGGASVGPGIWRPAPGPSRAYSR